MGGKAHKDASVQRLSTSKWTSLSTHIKSLFARNDCIKRIEALRVDPEKSSHGDLDLITLIDAQDRETLNDICKQIRLTNKIDHSYLYDYLNEKHQVDLQVLTDSETFDLAYFCQSYGDLGIILSKCVRAMGMSLSSVTGLCHREKMPISGDYKSYTITKKPQKICEYLGLDFEQWRAGFTSRDAIFDWLQPVTPTFQMRPGDETRYANREMFQQFLKLARTSCIDHLPTSNIRTTVLQRLELDGAYARVRDNVEKDIAKEMYHSKFKEVFNACIVNTHLKEEFGIELQGKQLGTFLNVIRAMLPLNHIPTKEEVKQQIIHQYKCMYSIS